MIQHTTVLAITGAIRGTSKEKRYQKQYTSNKKYGIGSFNVCLNYLEINSDVTQSKY